MNAVIVGCGKVGSELAKTLVNDGHNVSIIDNSQRSLDSISEELDVMTILGNGTNLDLLKEAGVENADIFIAVSTSDEINLLSCMIAKQFSKCETIARVRDPIYFRQANFFKAKLGLSRVINPEFLAASEIYNILQFPALSRIDMFEGTNVVISTMHVTRDYKMVGKSLQRIRQETPDIKALVCAAVRGDEVIIPRGDFTVCEGDDITMVATRSDIRAFIKAEGIPNMPAENIMIVGGGTIAYYLTEKLLSRGRNVRLIDRDEKKCVDFSERFEDCEVIKGDGTDRKFIMKHGLSMADAFVPLTGIDEENIVIATYAKNASKAKIITKVTRTDMSDLIQTLALDSVVFPKMMCADIISQYVRAKNAGAGGNVATLFRYLDNRIEIAEYKATSEFKYLNVPFMELNLKKDLIVAGLIRSGEFIVPSGKNMIKENDSVIIVTTNKGITSLEGIVAKQKQG